MRLLTAAFVSPDEFLTHYRDQDKSGAVFYRSRTELAAGDDVLVEISFPGLPNRALVRGKVVKATPGKGAWVRIKKADAPTLEFLLQLARGDVTLTPTVNRSFARFPAELPVDCRIEVGEDDDDETSTERLVSRTLDLGAGGAFVRSLAPPPVGARVVLSIGPTSDQSFEAIQLEGHVAWIRDGDQKGFGVRFQEGSKTLRTALRKASETGRIPFAH
jgi:Tfp pilus assembly protein PilZ